MEMLKRFSLFLLALALAMTAFTFTVREIRNWRIPAEASTPVSQAVYAEESEPGVPVQPAVQHTLPEDLHQSRQTAITRAIQSVSPSVVGITVTQIRYSASPYMNDPFWRFMMPEMPRWFTERVQSLGSGIIFDAEGYIITNAHVVENAEEITITCSGGNQHTAEVVGLDSKTDLALLRITEPGRYPASAIGNSDEIMVGEWAIALGNPFGLLSESQMPIATAGIISSLHMDFGIQRSGSIYQDMIQTDASINSGNSGGPLVNSLGEVIGINTFIFSGNNSGGSIGIGFAIPINRAMEIIDELRERGFIDRRYTTGLTIQNLDRNLAQVLALDLQSGVIVVDVERQSPAHRAGIEVGDVIIGLNNERIRRDRDIFNYIRSQDLRTGDKLTFNIWRDGKRLDKSVTLEH